MYIEVTGGCITGGSGTTISGGRVGGGVYVNGGTFTMTGGTIAGNTADKDGSGVYVNDGTFSVSGSPVISGNKCVDGEGSGASEHNVYLTDGKTVTLGKREGEFPGMIQSRNITVRIVGPQGQESRTVYYNGEQQTINFQTAE